jgi:hypothetical protein
VAFSFVVEKASNTSTILWSTLYHVVYLVPKSVITLKGKRSIVKLAFSESADSIKRIKWFFIINVLNQSLSVRNIIVENANIESCINLNDFFTEWVPHSVFKTSFCLNFWHLFVLSPFQNIIARMRI